MRRLVLAALLSAAVAWPAAAETGAVQPRPVLSAAERAVPQQLTPNARGAWRALYNDLRAGRLDRVEGALRLLGDSPLRAHAEAELILARGAGAVADPLAWMNANRDLPQAERVAARLRAGGVGALPSLPPAQKLRWVSYGRVPERDRAHGDALEAAMKPLLAENRPTEAEQRWLQLEREATPASRTEWAHRGAWIFYLAGDDSGAMRMGAEAAKGTGEHAAMGAWVAGLGAWRSGDCGRAAGFFDAVASKYASDDLVAAGAYWASRAHMACGRPELVSPRLQVAARFMGSFYGLLARRALGIDYGHDWTEPDFIKADWNHLARLPGARRAAALVEVGQVGMADQELRHLAAIADPQHYEAIMRLAARLNLPATQLWLSQRSPVGARAPLAARFPAPAWRPHRGWRVEKGLVFAHALQESRFVTDAVSHAGARGVMQLMPGTAAKVSAEMGKAVDQARLEDPEFNIECGQTYLEELRDSVWTGGLLPKVIAAYNAGPGSVRTWNASVRHDGDPLLFIESIPFKETRHYVEVVMRNYWMYQLREGAAPPSMDALAAGLWPKFPGMPGATAVRLDPSGGVAAVK